MSIFLILTNDAQMKWSRYYHSNACYISADPRGIPRTSSILHALDNIQSKYCTCVEHLHLTHTRVINSQTFI